RGLEHRDALLRHAPARTLVRVGRVGVPVGHHPAARGERRLDDPGDVLAPRGEHQQGLGVDVQLLREQHRPELLAERRPARLARDDDVLAPGAQQVRDGGHMRALARAVDALERDELAATHRLVRRRGGSWYLATARLCSTRVLENSLVPSPLDTKYRASVLAGCITAVIEASPGMAIGCGGRPRRV